MTRFDVRAGRGRAAAVLGATALLVLLGGCSEISFIDEAGPNPPGDFFTQVEGRQVLLSWSAPSDPDLAASMIVRFRSTGLQNAAPVASRPYAVGDTLGAGEVIYIGNGTEHVDEPPCTQQVYGAWAADVSGNWSPLASSATATGVAALPPAPAALAATVSDGRVSLTWTNPVDARFASVKVVRKRSGPPTNAADGETVFAGSATSAVDATAELSPTITWRYAVFACNPCAECEPGGSHAQVTPTLVQSLQSGGFVVYWRHAAATTCADKQDSTIPEWWKSCDRNCATALARQLDDPAGIQQAQTIGQQVKQRAIPFSRVISSEYCRCRETAQHMNLGPVIETSSQVTFFVYPQIEPCAAIRSQLATKPAAGSNTAIVAHVHPQCIMETGLDLTLENGQAAIYKPDGMGGTALIAKVRYNDWTALP
jgi:phosphohistidine phosphatase SixA